MRKTKSRIQPTNKERTNIGKSTNRQLSKKVSSGREESGQVYAKNGNNLDSQIISSLRKQEPRLLRQMKLAVIRYSTKEMHKDKKAGNELKVHNQ